MEEYITPDLKLVNNTLSPLELHLDVTKDTLYMEMSQQLVKHQEAGVIKHQHAEVMHFTQWIHVLQQQTKQIFH